MATDKKRDPYTEPRPKGMARRVPPQFRADASQGPTPFYDPYPADQTAMGPPVAAPPPGDFKFPPLPPDARTGFAVAQHQAAAPQAPAPLPDPNAGPPRASFRGAQGSPVPFKLPDGVVDITGKVAAMPGSNVSGYQIFEGRGAHGERAFSDNPFVSDLNRGAERLGPDFKRDNADQRYAKNVLIPGMQAREKAAAEAARRAAMTPKNLDEALVATKAAQIQSQIERKEAEAGREAELHPFKLDAKRIEAQANHPATKAYNDVLERWQKTPPSPGELVALYGTPNINKAAALEVFNLLGAQYHYDTSDILGLGYRTAQEAAQGAINPNLNAATWGDLTFDEGHVVNPYAAPLEAYDFGDVQFGRPGYFDEQGALIGPPDAATGERRRARAKNLPSKARYALDIAKALKKFDEKDNNG
jgi:hypothetical protein